MGPGPVRHRAVRSEARPENDGPLLRSPQVPESAARVLQLAQASQVSPLLHCPSPQYGPQGPQSAAQVSHDSPFEQTHRRSRGHNGHNRSCRRRRLATARTAPTRRRSADVRGASASLECWRLLEPALVVRGTLVATTGAQSRGLLRPWAWSESSPRWGRLTNSSSSSAIEEMKLSVPERSRSLLPTWAFSSDCPRLGSRYPPTHHGQQTSRCGFWPWGHARPRSHFPRRHATRASSAALRAWTRCAVASTPTGPARRAGR